MGKEEAGVNVTQQCGNELRLKKFVEVDKPQVCSDNYEDLTNSECCALATECGYEKYKFDGQSCGNSGRHVCKECQALGTNGPLLSAYIVHHPVTPYGSKCSKGTKNLDLVLCRHLFKLLNPKKD